MKKMIIITVSIIGLLVANGFAQMHQGMMGSEQSEEKREYGHPSYSRGTGPGMMGYGGYGMMGPGMMGHMGGMMGPGMMGLGRGYGYGPQGYDPKEYQKFLDETTKLRKELHSKRFEYFEALRNPDTKRDTITNLEKEIGEIQKKIYDKAPQ